MARSWSFANDRRVIELSKERKSLKEIPQIMNRTPERIRKAAMRLGVSFKATTKKNASRNNFGCARKFNDVPGPLISSFFRLASGNGPRSDRH